jgi:hypothetical protein
MHRAAVNQVNEEPPHFGEHIVWPALPLHETQSEGNGSWDHARRFFAGLAILVLTKFTAVGR